MSSTSLFIPAGFSYAAASLLTVPLLLQWQAVYVSRARGAAKVEYPLAYADKAQQDASPAAKTFNCRQRAHANTLESVPVAVIMTLLSAIRYPIFAASVLGVWSVTRIIYTIGYGSGNPRGRLLGSRLGILPLTALLVSASKVVYDLNAAGL